MSNWGELYNYSGYSGCASHCYIKVVGNAVLCTEAEDNEGTSITNMAEFLATMVCRDYGIPMESLTWIEHYTRDEAALRAGLKETFDLVEFTIVDRPSPMGRLNGKRFINPKWKPANREYVKEVFGV